MKPSIWPLLLSAPLALWVQSSILYVATEIIEKGNLGLMVLMTSTISLLLVGIGCSLALYIGERNTNTKLTNPITEAKEMGFDPIGKIISDRNGRFSESEMNLIKYSLNAGKVRLDSKNLKDDWIENMDLHYDSIQAKCDLFKRKGGVIIVHPELLISHKD